MPNTPSQTDAAEPRKGRTSSTHRGIAIRNRFAIPGIGPWTASYVALRVAKDPDAFPESDWVVMKVLDTTAAGARRRAECWAPWRGYALMYLWYGSAGTGTVNDKKVG